MAYKTFANGFPLPASDLNNFLMNQSVIVFADAAARTSAIPSPVEGMLTYLEDTNAYESWNGSAFVNINDNTDAIPKSTVTTAQDLIVADGASSVTRLGVGADDQVLSVVAGEVAWADAGGGGGLTLLSTTTLSGSATVNITSISQLYKNIHIIGEGIYSSVFLGDDLKIKVNADNCWVYGLKTGGGSPSLYGNATSTVASSMGSSPEVTNFNCIIPNYAVAGFHPFNLNLNSRGLSEAFLLGMLTNSALVIDEINLENTGGNFGGGTIKIYGEN
jgi:hypothetical protein